MSLRSALEHLPHDRDSQALVRHMLAMFQRHSGEWIEPHKVAVVLGASEDHTRSVLATLAEFFVLDFDDGPPRYRYRADRFLDLEIDRFERKTETHTGHLQTNVEKFRQRYGGR